MQKLFRHNTEGKEELKPAAKLHLF